MQYRIKSAYCLGQHEYILQMTIIKKGYTIMYILFVGYNIEEIYFSSIIFFIIERS
jgi:hypothetical protein